jgi:very-short-patch-repair endonuclease/transposase
MCNYQNKDWLKEKIEQGLTQKQIAEMCGLKSTSTIAHYVKKFQITQPKNPLKEKDWIYYQYITLNKTTVEIGKEFNFRPRTVNDWTKRHMLNKKQSTRLNSYQDKTWLFKHLIELDMEYKEIAQISNVSLDAVHFWAEKYNIRRGQAKPKWSKEAISKIDNKEWLYNEYIVKDRSASEISNGLNISKSAVLRRLNKLSIKKDRIIITVECDNCLTNFPINNYRLERSEFHYCSIKCKNEHNHLELNKRKLYYNKDWLYDKLIIQNQSFKELESEIGISRITLMLVASKLGIKKKELGLQGNKNQEITILLKEKKWLKHQYITLDKDIEDLVQEFGFGKTTVARYLRRYNLVKEGDPRKGFHPQVTVNCGNCGKEVKRKIGRIYSNFHSCSKDCYHILYKKWFKESGHMEKFHEGNRRYYETPEGQEMRKKSGILGALALSNISETYIEKIIRQTLEKLKIPFIAQHPMGYFVVDFYIPDHRLVIEVNGDYWHWNPVVYESQTPPQKIKKNIRRDKAKIGYLSNRNYKILHLWEKDINTRLDWCIEEIKKSVGMSEVKQSL